MSEFISNGGAFYEFSTLPFEGEVIQASLADENLFGLIDSSHHLWLGTEGEGITTPLILILPYLNLKFRAVSIISN